MTSDNLCNLPFYLWGYLHPGLNQYIFLKVRLGVCEGSVLASTLATAARRQGAFTKTMRAEKQENERFSEVQPQGLWHLQMHTHG